MGKEIESMVGGIKKIDISHQEMDRLLQALEELYTEVKANTPDMEWMPVYGVGNLLSQELGYEDMAEFEDAMGDTFANFLRNFPHIILKADAKYTGGEVFQVKPDPPESEWSPTKYTITIREPKDLWRVCHKSSRARITVPSLEFEISPDGRRHIDTLYNHIAAAISDLTAHTSSMPDGGSSDTKEKILETVAELNRIIDVQEPWVLVMFDPSGVSEIKPEAFVSLERYDPEAE